MSSTASDAQGAAADQELAHCVIEHLNLLQQSVSNSTNCLIEIQSRSIDISQDTKVLLVTGIQESTKQQRWFWPIRTDLKLDTLLLNQLLIWHSKQFDNVTNQDSQISPLVLALVDDQGSVSCIETQQGLHSFIPADRLLKSKQQNNTNSQKQQQQQNSL
jgi:hypothetical protein